MGHIMPPRICEVDWVDSMVLDHGEWLDASDADEAMSLEGMVHHSVGYVVKENELAILLASSLGQNDRIQGAVVIPKVSVKDMRLLRNDK